MLFAFFGMHESFNSETIYRYLDETFVGCKPNA